MNDIFSIFLVVSLFTKDLYHNYKKRETCKLLKTCATYGNLCDKVPRKQTSTVSIHVLGILFSITRMMWGEDKHESFQNR